MTYVDRTGWGARPTSGTGNALGEHTRGVAVHWLGGTSGVRLATRDHSACVTTVRSVQRFHQVTRGWADIAYNFLACPHGVVFEGRGLDRGSAANGSTQANLDYYSVCALLGPGDQLTEALWAGLAEAVALCRTRAGDQVVGHRNLFPTECPGAAIYSSLFRLRTTTTAPPRPPATRPPVTRPPAPAPAHPQELHVRLIDLRNADTHLVTGSGVAPLQRLLKVPADGKGGPQTRTALGAAQTRAGLARDYIFGPDTAEALLSGKA